MPARRTGEVKSEIIKGQGVNIGYAKRVVGMEINTTLKNNNTRMYSALASVAVG